MLDATLASLSGVVPFLSYFVIALALVWAFIRIYTLITPHDEFALIRANNPAAAVAFAGALIGFAWPLAGAITHSMSLLDCAIWGAVALIVQTLTFFVANLTLKQLPKRISDGEIAAGIFSACCSISIGMLNAACMSY